ncbi:MAG TPA: hypothetical protein VMU51_15695 [Mycobacteriales bacterium]|nr:hypothetical protein [Mycobacteriales bacterium]
MTVIRRLVVAFAALAFVTVSTAGVASATVTPTGNCKPDTCPPW